MNQDRLVVIKQQAHLHIALQCCAPSYRSEGDSPAAPRLPVILWR